MSTRVLIVAGAAALAAAIAVFALSPARGVPDGAPSQDAMAAAIGRQIMEHLYRGHVPERSGEIMTVPKPHNYLIGEWDLTTLGTDEPTVTSSHPNPWDYLARVPIIVYGPGFAPSGLEVRDRVDIASLAPTYAELLGMEGLELDGEPLEAVLDEASGGPPKVIFTVVIDGGGWNALQYHPSDWPEIASLRRTGTTYTNATIGSAPSITGALHATFGTGLYPTGHKIPGNQMRGPDGTNTDVWQMNADPTHLEAPTVSELWDEQNSNRPIVGTVSYEGWHLGMIGHGAQRPGADHDIAVLWESEKSEFWTNEDFYELPGYLDPTDLATLESYEEDLDPRDGLSDGLWFGHTLEELQEPTVRPATPAFARFNGDAVIDIMRNEGIGKDDMTDLFWVEMKMPDYAGHTFNVTRPEEGDVIREVDRQIARFKAELDRSVGRGNYLLALSADHGQQPLPDLLGGWRINAPELERDIEERFGDGLVEKITTVDIFMDMEAVEEGDVSLDDIARYLGTYTIGENVPDANPGAEEVPEGRLDDELFAGAFSTGYLQDLTSARIEAFGAGDYPESDLGLATAEEG